MKAIITSDIHGYYSNWLEITDFLDKNDYLIIAGDLFGTKYADWNHVDYQPETIKDELIQMKNKFFFVYGNCDEPSFLPGYQEILTFDLFGQRICMEHGHLGKLGQIPAHIYIQGHTHVKKLIQYKNQVLINPGSPSLPKDEVPSIAIINEDSIQLISLDDKSVLESIPL